MPDAGDTAAVWVPVGELEPWDRNPRRNTEAAKRVAEAIRKDGWGAPIVAQSGTGRIIAGHTRWKAAAVLGLDVVPVRYVDVDDRSADRMALADNKLAEIADWDTAALADVLEGFSLDEVELMGWDSKELEKLADEVDFGPLEGGDDGERCPECGQKVRG